MKYIILVGNREFLLSWELQLINQLRLNRGEVTLLVGKQFNRSSYKAKFILYYAFKFIDNLLYQLTKRSRVIDPFEKISIDTLDLNKRYVVSERINGREELIIDFKTFDSIIIRLGFGIIGQSTIEKLGGNIYSLHHGDINFFRGGPAGFWEFILGEPRVQVTLQKINQHLDAGEIIDIGSVPVNRLSYRATLNLLYAKGLDLYFKQIEKKFRSETHESTLKNSNVEVKGVILRRPTNWQFFPLLIKAWFRVVKTIFQKVLFEVHWSSYVREIPAAGIICSFSPKFMLKAAKGTYLADPFILETDKETFIFVEEFVHSKGIGTISVLDHTGRFLRQDLFNSDSHRSFPQVISFNNKLFLITESQILNKLVIYEFCPKTISVNEIYCVNDISLVDCSFYAGKDLVLIGCRRYSELGNADDTHYALRLKYKDEQITGHEELLVDSDLPLWARRPASSIFDGKFMWFQHNFKFYGETLLRASIKIQDNVIFIRRSNEKLGLRNDRLNPAHIHTLNISNGYMCYDQRTLRYRWKKYI